MEPIVTCHDVSIRYITGDFKDIGVKEYLIRKLTGNYQVTEFWADRHVTFDLMPGDMLGIIGSNGAGKSTILKAISGIMVPTEGYVKCHAKISALLELASGFDGDLTVRENTYLRAAMLGYSRDFVDATYDSIIDFAELRGFEDRPFKQLSSGMKSRLAFSIASLVKPEILILDEVLSVGDGAFRKKSEAKMREIIAGGATTILVSHSVGQVRALCNKILWLNHGEQVAFGTNVAGLCDAYEEFLNTKKMPEKLPAFDLADPPAPRKAAEPAVTEEPVAPAAPAATARSFDWRKVPRAVWVTLIVVALLTGVIAISEATLPGRVHALPGQADRVLYRSDTSPETVCLWDSKLYVFSTPAAVQGKVFRVVATDNHDNVTRDELSLQDGLTRKFCTDETAVLEINLGYYPGYVHLEYGVAPAGSDWGSWDWSATYPEAS